MKKIVTISLVLTLVLVAVMFASSFVQTVNAEEIKTDQSTLTVYGSSSVSVEPDIAYVTIGVISENKDLKVAQNQNTKTINAVIAKIVDSGIAKEDIKTTSYYINPKRDYNTDTNEITGYDVRNELQIAIKDITKIGSVIDGSVSSGANYVGAINFMSTKKDDVYLSALELAYVSANKKALALAKASDKKIDSILSVSETSNSVIPYDVQPRMMISESVAGDVPIETGMLSVSADVTVTYIIK